MFNLGGEVNVNFVRVDDHLLAVGELPYGLELDPVTLETRAGADEHAFFKYNDSLSELGVGCAHAVKLPPSGADNETDKSGYLINKISTIPISHFGLRTDYKIYQIKPGTSERKVLATFSKNELAITYAHAFPVPSSKYAVLPFWPLTISKAKVLVANNLKDGMRWVPEDGTNLTVVDLETGKATTFRCNETFFGFHFANAFVDEERGEIVADVVLTDSTIFDSLGVEAFRTGAAIDNTSMCGALKRIRIPLAEVLAREREDELGETEKEEESCSFLGERPDGEMVGTAARTVFRERFATTLATIEPFPGRVSDVRVEAPRINDAWATKKDYRYVYAWHATRPNNYPNALVKFDVSGGVDSIALWTNPEDEFGVMMGEAVFVAAPAAAEEDDGVVISSGLHIKSGRAFVVVLDAKTMTELARAYAKTHVTFGFHTQFYQN